MTSKDSTIDEPDFIVGYQIKAEIYANWFSWNFKPWISKTAYELYIPPILLNVYHKPHLRVRAALLHFSYTCPASVGFQQSGAYEPPKAVGSSV